MTADINKLKTGKPAANQRKCTEFDSVIENAYKTLNEQLMQLFNGMIKNATGRLVILEGLTEGFENRTIYQKQSLERESIRYMLSDVSDLSFKFFININEQLKPAVVKSDTLKVEELSLVSHDEMEEMVAITTMHANAVNDFGEAISDLNARVEYLEIKNAAIFSTKAISPKGLSEAYLKTLNQLNVGTVVNLTLLKLFDEEVNQKLESLYSSLNQIFIDADVMPEIIRVSRDNDTPKEETAYSTEHVDYFDELNHAKSNVKSNHSNTNFIPHSQAELYDIVSRFTRGDISVTGNELDLPTSILPASFSKNPVQQNSNSEQYYQRKDVVRSLNRLQKKLIEQGENTGLNDAEEIKRSLISDIGATNTGGGAKEVTVLDERNIDFVGMIFNAISHDISISDVITKLVTQLQIPVMKVALDDEKLFQDKTHPTRKVLNLIPRAGKGVTDIDDHTYNKIEQVVNNILTENDVDVVSFRKAVDALHKIIHSEEETAANNEREEQRSVIKAHARTVVVAELRKHSAGKILPKYAQALILKHMATLMLNRYIKHGAESGLWSQATTLCKLTIDLLQPVKNKEQWEQLNNNHNALIDSIHDELYETEQDKQSIDTQIGILNTLLNKMIDRYGQVTFDNKESKTSTVDYATQKQMDEYDAEIARIKAQEESVVEKVARLPAYVKAGAWFEIYNGEDRAIRRLKMSVILLETASIVFVDHKGIKGIEKDAGEFAEELNTNKSRIIADHATFDNALGKVISMMAA